VRQLPITVAAGAVLRLLLAVVIVSNPMPAEGAKSGAA
jgi:hypothetical protein